jgi:hypothetical protein
MLLDNSQNKFLNLKTFRRKVLEKTKTQICCLDSALRVVGLLQQFSFSYKAELGFLYWNPESLGPLRSAQLNLQSYNCACSFTCVRNLVSCIKEKTQAEDIRE